MLTSAIRCRSARSGANIVSSASKPIRPRHAALSSSAAASTSNAGDDRRIVYTHGHAAPVVQNHAARTCEDFAPHVVKLICPGDSLLDVGCGPGSITKGQSFNY